MSLFPDQNSVQRRINTFKVDIFLKTWADFKFGQISNIWERKFRQK